MTPDRTDPALTAVIVDPDCLAGKHTACPGWTYDLDHDHTAPCECTCHDPNAEAPHP